MGMMSVQVLGEWEKTLAHKEGQLEGLEKAFNQREQVLEETTSSLNDQLKRISDGESKLQRETRDAQEVIHDAERAQKAAQEGEVALSVKKEALEKRDKLSRCLLHVPGATGSGWTMH